MPITAPRRGENPADTLARFLPRDLIPMGDRHMSIWDWVAHFSYGAKPPPRVEVWPRCGAKSTMAELISGYTALSLTRRFVLYVCDMQHQADFHIQGIGGLLDLLGIRCSVNDYSSAEGWRAWRIEAENGWGAMSVGLEGRATQKALEKFSPDLIILDDVDSKYDSETATQEKLNTLNNIILPSSSADAGLLFLQNMVRSRSTIARVADGTAGMALAARVKIEPAVRDLEYKLDGDGQSSRYRITRGVATWKEGQPLAVCETQINEWGIDAFLAECQHEEKAIAAIAI